ncbi:MAG: hypothetical protein IIC90_11430 [Chloroflexi bacterium]|nr:hypothetical protein [Chloroflexota bacterium]
MRNAFLSPYPTLLLVSLSIGALAASTGCTHPLQRKVEAYREAKKRGDTAEAARFLAHDARIWFGKKEGEGAPLRPEGGPYAEWDRHFRSTSTREDFQIIDRTVSYLSMETNDFYRLIDGQPGRARITYFFDDQDKISGMLYEPLTPKHQRPPDRYDDFKIWAGIHYPGLLESPEMEIPNQPQRWRALLTEWTPPSM